MLRKILRRGGNQPNLFFLSTIFSDKIYIGESQEQVEGHTHWHLLEEFSGGPNVAHHEGEEQLCSCLEVSVCTKRIRNIARLLNGDVGGSLLIERLHLVQLYP